MRFGIHTITDSAIPTQARTSRLRSRRPASRAALFAAATILAASGASLMASAAPAQAASRLGGVDMQRACNTQWPGYGLSAHVNNSSDAYSWRCWAPFDHSTYGINVTAECVTQYGGGAYAGLGNSRDPYSWYCQR